jgi:hypothetical protein
MTTRTCKDYKGEIPVLHAFEGFSEKAVCGYEYPVQEHHTDPPVFPAYFMDDANTHLRPRCKECFATIDKAKTNTR